MKTKRQTKWLAAAAVVITVFSSLPAQAAQILIYSNETFEQNANKMILDADDTGGPVTLQFGKTLNKQLYWDPSANGGNGAFIFSDDLNVAGDLKVDGVITAGTGAVAITLSNGQLDGTKLADDSVKDNAIDFGMGANQVGADDITMTDNFANSNSTNVQGVMQDVDTAIGDRNYTNNNYVSDGQSLTQSIDSLDQSLKSVADTASTASLSGTGTTSNIFTLDTDNTGGNVTLVFGAAANQYLLHNGTSFVFSDDVLVNGNLDINGTVNGTNLTTTGLNFNDNATVGSAANTLAVNSTNWSISSTGATTGLSIDGETNNITNVDWTSLKTRTKTIPVTTVNEPLVVLDGSNNQADMYLENETGANGHMYYYVTTTQASLQDLDLKFKVQLPADFVDFANTGDISFNYKNDGAASTDSAVSITVTDAAGNSLASAANLFNSSWASWSSELTGTHAAGNYIYVTVKGAARKNGATTYLPYMGEIVLNYTGR